MSSVSQGGFFLCKLLELSRRTSDIFPLSSLAWGRGESMGGQRRAKAGISLPTLLEGQPGLA